MQKETRRNSAAGSAKPNPPRKLTRAEKKQIAEIIRQAKGDGKAHTAQQTIPYIQMYPDGICKVTGRKYSKTVAFEDINYQLAQADDKTAIFENWCDFLNYFDASVSVQLSFINQGTQRGEAEKAVNIPAQEDAFNSIRTEYRDMLKNQLAKGNNGLVKAKYITFAIEADSLGAAKSRLARIETDVLNNFKLLGVSARPMTGYERLKMLHGIFHPEGGQFAFDFSWLAPSGLSTKDFIAPSSFRFGEGRYFRMGRKIGAVSFLEILAPELNDRILSDILDLETGVIVNLHIHSIDQTEAIKTIKRKITDLDKMKIEEQKKAVRSGYDMDIIPSDLATFGSEAKNLFTEAFKPVMRRYFSSKSGLWHYLQMAEGNYREYLRGDMVKAKKYFYVLRPILACRWILEKGTPPPMLFSELAASQLPDYLEKTVAKLLDLKMNSPEVKMIPRIDILNAYMDRSIAEVRALVEQYPREITKDWEELNALFLAALEM